MPHAHQVHNAPAVAAAVHALGRDTDLIVEALSATEFPHAEMPAQDRRKA
ncbi:hypothetical protein [Streptomyces sp. NPDC048473]